MLALGSGAVRTATESDLVAIRAIYNHYVLTSTCTYQLEPESEEDRREWFRGRSARHPVIVADVQGEVVGWAALSPWSKRAGYDRTVEASVYVRADQHRKGVGRALLLDLLDRARALGHHVVIGGASTDQPASIALQEALGFEHVACFREVGYKFGRWLDVVYLQKIL
jgi:L-amino acid N-acyltransferase YncA